MVSFYLGIIASTVLCVFVNVVVDYEVVEPSCVLGRVSGLEGPLVAVAFGVKPGVFEVSTVVTADVEEVLTVE